MRLGWAALAVFTALLTFEACRPGKGKSVFIDPALEILVPPDTAFVTGADLDAIRTTHVFQKYLGEVKLQQLDDFARKTGVDPRKDISQILSCSNGKSGMLLARGKFSAEDGEPRIEIDGVKRMNYKGLNMFGNEQSAVLFLNKSTAAAGRTPDLRALVDLRNQGHHGLPAALKAEVARIPASNQVWVAFMGGLQSFDLGVPEESNAGQAVRLLRGIDSGTLAINLRDGFRFAGHLECKTPNDAKHVRDAIKGVVGLGRLSTPANQPDLLKLYDAIQADNDQNQVIVSAQIAPDLEDKFLDLWLKRK